MVLNRHQLTHYSKSVNSLLGVKSVEAVFMDQEASHSSCVLLFIEFPYILAFYLTYCALSEISFLHKNETAACLPNGPPYHTPQLISWVKMLTFWQVVISSNVSKG